MDSVKTREIKDVRELLSNDAREAELALSQMALVADWINSFARGKTLLELGCGQGRLAELLSARYCGVDPIRHEDLCGGFDFRTGSGENIPYEDGSFDYVLIKDAINYFAELVPVLREASRVLRPEGAVLITEFVGPTYRPFKQKLKNLVKKHLRLGLNVWDKTYLNYYTSHDIMTTARRWRFTVEYEYASADRRYYLVIRKQPEQHG